MNHDELDINRELIEQEVFETGDNPVPVRAAIDNVTRDVPASQLQETDQSNMVRCSFCKCFMVGMLRGFRVCQFHNDNGENAGECPTCARRSLIHSPGYIASGLKSEPVHPTPPEVLPEAQPTEPAAIVSPVNYDEDIEGTVRQLAKDGVPTPDKTELDKEYYDTFNGVAQECKDLDGLQLQAVRHRMLRMIRRAKIAVNCIVKLEEGRIQVLEAKKRQKYQELESEFQSKRHARGDASGDKKAKKTSDAGLSQTEKQIKQFVKLNMNEATIRATLTTLGTQAPSNLAELIAKFKK